MPAARVGPLTVLQLSTRSLALCLLLIAIAVAEPCTAADRNSCLEVGVQPTYPAVNASPIVQTVTQGADGATNLSGANCFEGQSRGALWISVASIVQTARKQNELIERFGSISALREVQYWSTTEHGWRPLVSAAFAVDAADLPKPRADYSAAELATGVSRYFRITDTRSGHAIGYRLQVQPGSPGRVIVDTTNIEPVRKWGITLYEPEGIRTLYFLNERSPGIWSYYSITRVVPATFLAQGHEKSYINRAVALFRYYMQLPAKSDPPPAR